LNGNGVKTVAKELSGLLFPDAIAFDDAQNLLIKRFFAHWIQSLVSPLYTPCALPASAKQGL
jgi:hypothetical protein